MGIHNLWHEARNNIIFKFVRFIHIFLALSHAFIRHKYQYQKTYVKFHSYFGSRAPYIVLYLNLYIFFFLLFLIFPSFFAIRFCFCFFFFRFGNSREAIYKWKRKIQMSFFTYAFVRQTQWQQRWWFLWWWWWRWLIVVFKFQ